MAARQTETAVEKASRIKDKRLRKIYGIDLTEHDRRRAEQHDRCKICGGALDAFGPPNVDHFHFAVKAFRNTTLYPAGASQKWYGQAYSEHGHVICVRHEATKAAALLSVKTAMMPWSVRGLLCFKCNKGLGYVERFFGATTNPEILNNVRDYLAARL